MAILFTTCVMIVMVMYRIIAVQATLCSVNCKNCTRANICTSCDDGYYPLGRDCRICISYNCQTCYNDSICASCTSGFWDSLCYETCEQGCMHGPCDIFTGQCAFPAPCATNCEACASANYCTLCKKGYHGAVCHLNCSTGCKGGCNKTDGICYECQQGRYGFYCEYPCPQQCLDNKCNQVTGKCNACTEGFNGSTCNQPTCPQNCSACNNQTCLQCKAGNHGEQCKFMCSTNCSQDGCNISTGHCFACINSRLYGPTCKEMCNTSCLENVCDHHTGDCIKGCAGNYYGNKCQYSCPAHCASNGARRVCSINGTCSNGCVQNYIGLMCDSTCSTNCVTGSDGYTCLRSGECLHGCVQNYYGHACRNQCPQKCAPIATRNSCSNDGTCVGGCVDGYSGDRCNISKIPADNESHKGTSQETKQAAQTAVIAGSVGGVVVLIVIGVVIVVVIMRKRRGKETSDQSARFDEDQPTSTNEYHTIGTLPERSTAIRSTHVVANPNYDSSQDVISLRRSGNNLQSESDTDVDVLEIDEDERRTLARHQERPNSPAQQEENVYYIGLQDIQKRKIVVDEIADFVASKPFEYFNDEFDKFPYGLTRPHNEARKPDNVAKNRYQGIYAYDETRVKVKGGNNDYINANFIDGYLKRNAYIASLGPMKKQMGDFGIFWKMIWQNKVERVVMVTNLDEEKKTKCEKYWPDVDDTKVYGDVLVKGLTEEVYAEYTRRTFKMTKGSNARTLHHLHFTAWPDKGIPEDVTALIEFRQRVLRVPAKLEGPTLVHCSAGIGRTGTYIALDILIHEGEAEGAVEIHGCVLNMRRNRVNMIQTAEQYEFLHRALVHALTFDCAPVAADQLQNFVSKTGQQQREKQFNQLMSVSQHVVPEERINMARNKSLKNKNRPGADIPGDEYRPRLQVRSTAGDYINAVYIDSFKTKRHYIAAQSPLPGTVVDFLSLVYKEDCPCIVSFEHAKESKDVGMYYPADNQVLTAEDFTVSSFKMDEQMEHCVLRRLVVENKKNGGQKKTVTLMSYADWEQDRSIPNSPANFIQFINNVEQLPTEGSNSGPIVLHCLDGAKMCGLFSVVSTLLQKIAIDHEVSVVNAVRKVKARRHGAISTQEQFDFCHECVLQYIRSFGIYSNIAP